ncbi:MAG: hypothetical protein HQ519_09870 [Planctomycetes bacterium]|nr:hypothetical protein [Planctomycetota bacterium]
MLLLLLLSLSAWTPTSAFAQDPVEFSRLSSDQRQLAEQVRRLEKILLALEQREELEGSKARVELLRSAREKLADIGDERPLATILEEVASDLTELRAGSALEQQAELIQILQELLDYLMETERQEQVQGLLEEAQRRAKEMRELADQQAKLREQTEALEKEEVANGKTEQAKRDALAEAQAKLNQKMRDLAQKEAGETGAEQTEEAADAGKQAEEDLRDDPKAGDEGEKSEEKAETQPGEKSEEGSSEESETKPGQPKPQQSPPGQSKPSSPQDLKEAQEHQKEAEEKLQQAADQAQAEAEQLADMQEMETLIDVLEKAEELAERHRRILGQFDELILSMNGASRVPRSARVQLRQWATEQKQIAAEAKDLLFEIREAGADSFPFLLQSIVEDHILLGKRIGPPRYRADKDNLDMAARLVVDWQRLIDAIRTEAERLRKKAEAPPEGEGGEPEKKEEPLVSFAAEVQLLKSIQTDLRQRIEALRNRQDLLNQAGVKLDEDDLAELDQLAQRQKRLRSLFESILERMRAEQDEAGEDV